MEYVFFSETFNIYIYLIDDDIIYNICMYIYQMYI